MNPPFSAVANVDRRMADAPLAAHLLGALPAWPKAAGWSRSPERAARPDNPVWTDAFLRLQERGRIPVLGRR